jgi:hypothetical protein
MYNNVLDLMRGAAAHQKQTLKHSINIARIKTISRSDKIPPFMAKENTNAIKKISREKIRDFARVTTSMPSIKNIKVVSRSSSRHSILLSRSSEFFKG